MAAVPVAAVVCATLPRAMDQAVAERLLRAAREAGAAYGCPVVGGDISVSDGPLVLSVTVLAEPAGLEPVTRGPARPGDELCVSGRLGGSGAGHHLSFEPRLGLARALASEPATRPTAMIDLSDGLAADSRGSPRTAEVPVAGLPLREGLPDPGWERALGDGEDYELLFAVPAEAPVPAVLEGVPLTRIGRVTAGGGVRWLDAAGGPLRPSTRGWEHRG